MIELIIPDIGGSRDVNVVEVYVKQGDIIKKDDSLLMLETDKATMEVPATSGGKVLEVLIKVGNKVNQGDIILKLDALKEESINSMQGNANSNISSSQNISNDTLDSKIESKNNISEIKTSLSKQINEVSFDKVFASPSIRKLARENNVDLTKIKGTGEGGRILEDDVKKYFNKVENFSGQAINFNLIPWPNVDFSKFGEIEALPLSRIKKISGANLSRNWVMIPHVTQFDEADITELEEFRKNLNKEYENLNIKINMLVFLIKACCFALKQFPELNSSLDGDNVIYKKYYNIGFAVDTKQGLLVPVIKNVDKKGVIDIANELMQLITQARDGSIKQADMQGGTFTISSLGGLGGTAFTPIINAPEVAILGISNSSLKPIWQNNQFVPRLMLPLSLSYDHRVIDGALAAKFTTFLTKVLADVRRLVL